MLQMFLSMYAMLQDPALSLPRYSNATFKYNWNAVPEFTDNQT